MKKTKNQECWIKFPEKANSVVAQTKTVDSKTESTVLPVVEPVNVNYTVHGTLKEFLARYKPEALFVRFGKNHAYARYNTEIKLLKPYVRDVLIRDYCIKPTPAGATLFITTW